MTAPPPRFLALRLRLTQTVTRLEWVGRRTRFSGERAPVMPGVFDAPLDPELINIELPQDFDAVLQAAVEAKVLAGSPGALPLFLAFPSRFAALPWDRWLAQLLLYRIGPLVPGLPYRLPVVRLAPGAWQTREPPSLPLRILGAGATGRAALALFAAQPWYVSDPLVQQHSIVLQQEAALVSRKMLQQQPDIVVVPAADLEWLHAAVRGVPFAQRPRLIIALELPLTRSAETLPPAGVAQVSVTTDAPLPFDVLCNELLLAIVHDQPLHMAVAAVRQQFEGADLLLRLTANPRTSHSLRLSDALGDITDQAAELPALDPLRFADPFNAVAPAPAPPSVPAAPRAPSPPPAPSPRPAAPRAPGLLADIAGIGASIRNAVDRVRQVFDFAHESGFIVPMAGAIDGLAGARRSVGTLETLVQQATAPPVAPSLTPPAQERRVDLALRQLEREPDDPPGYVQRGAALVPAVRYRLRLRIGSVTPENLILGETPPIDLLLGRPDSSEGYRLQAVLYPIDFTLDGPAVRTLTLPMKGASDTVFFGLVTPARSGAAQFRLALYHANHMLQAFLLTAWIGPDPVPAGHPRPGFSLAFSRTARFANLQDLPERALNIAVNSGTGIAGSHALHVKGDGDAAARLSLTEKIMSECMDAYRAILRNATRDAAGNPRFLTYPEPGTPVTAEFHATSCQLAVFGRDLYRALFIRGERALRPQLRALAAERDKTIQVVRFDPNFVFPWSVIYDFPLPEGTPPEMCRGMVRQPDGREVPCSHDANTPAYCINGFWGVRHVLEELSAIVERDAADAVTMVSRADRNGAVRLAMDIDDPGTQQMRDQLRTQLGSGFAPVEPLEDVLDLLWQPDKRPSVLILLGHVRSDGGEPRITLPGGTRALGAGEILDRVARGEWGQPCTLVLLMGCDTGMIEIGTLNGFVQALSSAGAGGVVGTECIAFSRLLGRFASEIALALWQPDATLGRAVTQFRRDMLGAGNPLAFIFQVLGTADLHLVWRGTS